VKKAYEQALDSVGLDLLAGPIWKDYIAYIGNLPVRRVLNDAKALDTKNNKQHYLSS